MHRSTYGCPETRQGATERRIGIRFEHCGVCDIGTTPSYHFPAGVIKAIYRRNSNLFRKETGRRTGEASRFSSRQLAQDLGTYSNAQTVTEISLRSFCKSRSFAFAARSNFELHLPRIGSPASCGNSCSTAADLGLLAQFAPPSDDGWSHSRLWGLGLRRFPAARF